MATVEELFQMVNTLQGRHHVLNQEISRLTAENQQFRQAGSPGLVEIVTTFGQAVQTWIRGSTKIGPALEVITSYLPGKYGVEIRIESVNTDSSHSWVRISHGLNTLVTDLIDKEYDDNEQETSETKTEAFALKTDVFVFASRSKAKAKPRRPTSACSSTRTAPIRERKRTDIDPGAQSNQAYPAAKRLNTLLRHGQLPREEGGAIEFWRLKMIFGTNLRILDIGLMKCGRAPWQEEEETRKDTSTVLILQEQLCISELFKDIQDAILLILH